MSATLRSRKRSHFDYSQYFREARLLHDLTTLPQHKCWRAVPPRQTEPHRVVVYFGCNVLRNSHMIRTATAVLDLLAIDYVALGGPAFCCGIVHHREGDTELAETLAVNAVRFFERFEPARVVMWCPSCIYFYDEVFQVPASFVMQHFTEFLVDHLRELRFVQEVPARVALHYHCNQPRRLREGEAAGTLLSAVPGLELVKIDSDVRLDRSCGVRPIGTGTWEQLIERQLREAVDAGATTFATLYHGCQRLICAYQERYPLVIEHYLSVFARALGIEFEDLYKKYRLWKDPDRVLSEMAPCLQANRVSEVEARRLVLRTFPGD